jgi:RimJ/RimL family protein N-acetyltransferase
VVLVPLERAHLDDLARVGLDAEIWRYLPIPAPTTADELGRFVDAALAEAATEISVPFAIVEATSGRAIGSTRYLDIRPASRGLEIGWTWLARAAWRTPINTECKYLLLRHAFESLDALRVQLKTDSRNERSRRAIERIGGRLEGILRCDRVLWDGYVRDSAYFSVIQREWPDVKQALEARLARPACTPIRDPEAPGIE